MTPADRQIAILQARIDALEYEVQNLRTALYGPGVAFAALRLQPVGRVILAALMARDGISRAQLAAVIEAARPMFGERVENSEKCAVARLRRRLEPYGVVIETLPGSGYRIASDMKARLKELAG